jgi:hypothetical protein
MPNDTKPGGLTAPVHSPSGPDPRVVEGLRDVDAGRVLPLEVVRLAFELRFAIEETPDPERVRSEVLQLLGITSAS